MLLPVQRLLRTASLAKDADQESGTNDCLGECANNAVAQIIPDIQKGNFFVTRRETAGQRLEIEAGFTGRENDRTEIEAGQIDGEKAEWQIVQNDFLPLRS